MKDFHWKIIAGLLVLILVLACILWYQGFRQPIPNPDAPSFADSIRKSQGRAGQFADTVNKYHSDYENKFEGYRGSIDPDSIEREQLGTRIESEARADSIRKRAPR